MKITYISKNESSIPVKNGQSYEVYAFMTVDSEKFVLLKHDYGRSWWLPIELFKIDEDNIPPQWFVKTFESTKGTIGVMMGYDEIIHNDMHYVDLFDREGDAELIFERKVIPRTSPIQENDVIHLVGDMDTYGLKDGTLGLVKEINTFHQIYTIEFVNDAGETIIVLPVPRMAIRPFEKNKS